MLIADCRIVSKITILSSISHYAQSMKKLPQKCGVTKLWQIWQVKGNLINYIRLLATYFMLFNDGCLANLPIFYLLTFFAC